ncbi:retrotransposon protein, putative, ty1-copia subclass [Tanacetum coccineum]
MHSLGKTVNELHAMLKLHEQTLNLPKNNAPALHAYSSGKSRIGHRKWNCPLVLSRKLLKKKRTQPLELVVVQSRVFGSSHMILDYALRLLLLTLHQQNGVSESILILVPTKKVEKTPYRCMAMGKPPKLVLLKKSWGCEALVKQDTLTKPDKLEPRQRVGSWFKLPPNEHKPVGCKWPLFKKKTECDGVFVHTYKARLVAKGYTQTQGIDYEETFSPVTDIRAIRILIAIAAHYDYEIWQMDVKTASSMDISMKRCYMEQPEGFVNPRCTRTDVAFRSENITLSRFQQNHCESSLDTVKYILEVLSGGAPAAMLIGRVPSKAFIALHLQPAEYMLPLTASTEAVMG